MKFQYRFAALLELRRRQRDEAGAAVGQANEAIARIDQQREALNQQRTDLRQQTVPPREGRLSVDRLLAAGRFDMQLEADERALLHTRGELIQELARRQQKLILAEAELKRFEKLQARERQRFDAELRRREMAESDDATSRRYTLSIQRGKNR